MKRVAICTIAVFIAGLSATVQAADKPSWNYMSWELVASGDAEANGDKEDLEGYRLDVSKEFGGIVFLRAASNAYHVDVMDILIDIGSQQLGVGAHYPLSTGPAVFDLWGGLNYERVTIEGLVGTGAGIDIGARAKFMQAFEVGVAGKVFGDIDFGNGISADYTGYSINASYDVMPELAIMGSYSNYELDIENEFKFKYKGIVGLGVRLMY